MKAIIINSEGKKVKTISAKTNTNGYFWKKFNEYCNNKGYTKRIENQKYIGFIAWSNGSDVLEMKWLHE